MTAIALEHPLVEHHLAKLRDRDTQPEPFRQSVRRLATLLAYEATRDLATESIRVATPLTETAGHRLAESIAVVPILRAGLGMVDPVLELLPHAQVHHLGLYRDEATAEPVEYYSKLPDGDPLDVAMVLDPMLATGGSATAALQALADWGVKRLKLVSIIAAAAGVAAVLAQFPETQIYVCAIDSELNADKFIVPGLGDAGDRTFGTE